MWQTLESDPGLFTELIERLGVDGVEVRELLSVDLESLQNMGTIYGLLFLFKYRQNERQADDDDGVPAEQAQVVFAQQVAENACATQALLAVLLNSPGIELGSELAQFKEFIEPLDPESRGDAIAMSEYLQNRHNYMCKPQMAVNDGPLPAIDEENNGLYHYTAYVPTSTGLFELDGLKSTPIFHGSSSIENMVATINRRIARHAGDLRISLLAVTKDMRQVYRERGDLQMLAAENERRERAAKENAIRRSSHTAFVLTLLKQLAAKSSDSEWSAILESARRYS